jgi:uncharacterized protein (DUF924 family)
MAAMSDPEPALNPPAKPAATPQEVLAFWFDAAHERFWFEKSEAFDRLCVAALLPAHEKAMAGALTHWQETTEGSLALVLLLDQLPRNAFRGQAQAFGSDAKARAVAHHALLQGHDLATAKERRLFLYLPFEHSEALADQFLSEALFATFGDKDLLFYATRHREIVERFGRFPHRNAILGRDTTAAEQQFLTEPHSSF